MITLSGTSALQQVKKAVTPSILTRFMTWAENQQDNRFVWLGIALAVHGCFITPLTTMIVMATTYNFALFGAAIGAMALSLVTNLAALPTKITIPAFFLSILIDVVIIGIALASV